MSRDVSKKVILIGPAGVGKTCLINAFNKRDFDQYVLSTVAASESYIDVTLDSGEVVTLALWDTAGQENLRSFTTQFYRNAVCTILCLSAGEVEENIGCLESWRDLAQKEVLEGCQYVVVLTKVDVLGDKRQDIHETLQDEANRLDLGSVFDTSALNGEGVNNLLEHVANLANSVKISVPSGINIGGNTGNNSESCGC